MMSFVAVVHPYVSAVLRLIKHIFVGGQILRPFYSLPASQTAAAPYHAMLHKRLQDSGRFRTLLVGTMLYKLSRFLLDVMRVSAHYREAKEIYHSDWCVFVTFIAVIIAILR